MIGSTGFDANYAQGMDYDDAAGILYLAAYNNSGSGGELRIADTSTGNTALVGGFPSAAEVDGLGIASGGSVAANAWVFDPAAPSGSRWTTLPDPPFEATYGAALAIGNRIYYGGARDAGGDIANVAALNPATNTWITYPSLSTARGGAGMWQIGNQLLIGGGGWSSYLTSIESYDTTQGPGGSWSPFAASLGQGRRTFGWATDTTNNRLFAAAGWAGTFLATAEKYEWTMLEAASEPSAATLRIFAGTNSDSGWEYTMTSQPTLYGVNLPFAAKAYNAGGGSYGLPINEGFEVSVPPANWTRVQTNPRDTWKSSAVLPYAGSYMADCEYDDQLAWQDELLLTPEFLVSNAQIQFYTKGNIYWCRDTYDNCDLQVWLVRGGWGGGDDIYVRTVDADWTGTWEWSPTTINLTPYLPAGTPVRLGFRYLGQDGAQVGIDAVSITGS